MGLLLENADTVSVFKEKICKEHEECFPSLGEINVSALKVNCGDQCYHLPDSMILSQAFQAMSNNNNNNNNNNASSFLLSVDVEMLTTKTAAEEKTKKRKMKTSAGANKSQKKPALGDVQGEVQALAMSPTQAIEKACPVSNLEANSQAEEKNCSEDHIHHSKDHVDATSENSSGEENTNTLLLMAVGNESEMGTKDNGDKDADEATKAAKKIRTKKGKTPAKEDASSAGNFEPDVVTKDQQENVDKIVKKSSKKSNKKPSSDLVEES